MLRRWLIVPLLIAALAPTAELCAQKRRITDDAGITVFFEPEFRGNAATFRQDMADLPGLNDRIASLKVPAGQKWEVCEHRYYKGRCEVVSGEDSDLSKTAWNKVISSLRRVGGGRITRGGIARAPADWYIVLHDRPTYRGTPTSLSGSRSDLLGKRVQSVTIGAGVWQLCEGKDFSGRCVMLTRSVPRLAAYGIRYRIRSVRPVPKQLH